MTPFITDFEVEAPYVHSTGPGMGRFLGGLKERTIFGRRCEACDRVVVPAADNCETCGAPLTEWTTVGPEGTVAGSAARADGTTVVRVLLDGAGTELIHLMSERPPRGARVRPVWAAERTGAIGDIERFEVVQ